MLDRLKQLWTDSPWYVKALLVFVAVFAVFLPGDLIHKVLDNFDRKKTDAAATKLEKQQAADDQKIAQDQGKLDELNRQKADVAKEDTDDATDFFNDHKFPPQ